MHLCDDPRLTYLNNQGYCVVRTPQRKIRPLGVIGCEGNSRSWLGTLDRIWKSKAPVPVPGTPEPVPDVSGGRTNDLDLSFGLNFLANALSMFGASTPGLDVAYKNARSVQFRLGEVMSVGIDPLDIGEYITEGTLSENNPFAKFFLGGRDTEALLITEVLLARSISVIAKRDANTGVRVDVPAIQAVLGTKVAVTSASSDSTEITYEGQEPLTFGIKVFRIVYGGGKWHIEGVEASAETAFGDEDSGHTETPRVLERELVEINFPDAA